MPPASRATRLSPGRRSARAGRGPVAVYHPARPAGKAARSKPRRPAEISLPTPRIDLAARLRVLQPKLRGRVERREALLDIVRAVNTTLEPAEIAELALDRAVTWVPAPCLVLVCSDVSGQMSVLAERGLDPDLGPAVHAIARWVMDRGEEFATADLRRDPRVANRSIAAVLAFPLSCRGHQVGALIGLDRAAYPREPRLEPI